MKRGFTIIELLVASLLLGILVTILTMIFNQSSIAWRVGVAGVADLDEVRDTISAVREDADNAFIWNGKVQRILGLWDQSGNLRPRACDAEDSNAQNYETATWFRSKVSLNDSSKPKDFKTLNVSSGDGSKSLKNYTVNVKSAGPDREFNTWDDIWSFPDDFD